MIQISSKVVVDVDDCWKEESPTAVCVTVVQKKPLTENSLFLHNLVMKGDNNVTEEFISYI